MTKNDLTASVNCYQQRYSRRHIVSSFEWNCIVMMKVNFFRDAAQRYERTSAAPLEWYNEVIRICKFLVLRSVPH